MLVKCDRRTGMRFTLLLMVVISQLVGVIALQAELRAVSGDVGMGEVPVGGEIGLRHGILGFWSSDNEK